MIAPQRYCGGKARVAWWKWSRCDHSARVQRAASSETRVAAVISFVPLDAARLLAARRVPPHYLRCASKVSVTLKPGRQEPVASKVVLPKNIFWSQGSRRQ